MIFSSFPAHAPPPPRRRRFRIIVGLVGLGVIGLLALQYTHFRLLPADKTDTLWGVVVGMAAALALAEYTWAAAERRDRLG